MSTVEANTWLRRSVRDTQGVVSPILGALIIQTLTTTIYAAGVAPEVTLVVKGLVVLVVSILQSDKIKALVGAAAAGTRPSP